MDDLGPPSEASPEFFSCTARAPISLTKSHVSDNCANLLACSSRFGYAVIAHGSTLGLLKLEDIQHGNTKTTDLDLSSQGVNVIMSLQFVMGDTVLLVHAECEIPVLLLLHFSALVAGEIRKLPAPSGAITYAAYSDPNPSSTPPSQLLATLTSKVYIYNISAASCEKVAKVDVPGPLSLAISPSNSLLAIGTQRGCVSVHSTSNGSIAATIIEVESGWIPFAVHFVNEDALLVSYSRDSMTSYVMWTLLVDGDSVSIGPRFPFGELCLPSPDVGSEEDPTVIFNVIPSWDMCMISSSVSTEAEIIAKVDSDWQCWKLDESKSVYLPTNDEGYDTPPLGSALDFTDTNLIEPEDASSDMIQPMPRYLVLTSEFKILPYSLIDERPKAKCDHVRSPSALPPVAVASVPVDQATFPNFATRRSSAELSQEDTTSSTEGSLAVSEKTEGNRASYAETPLSSNMSDMFGSSPMTNLFPTPFRPSGETDKLITELQKRKAVLETEERSRDSFSDINAEPSLSTSIHTATKAPSSPLKTGSFTSTLPEPPNRSPGEVKAKSLVEGIPKTLSDDKAAPSSFKESLDSLPPRNEFTGTEKFLSHFSTQQQREKQSESVITQSKKEYGEEKPQRVSTVSIGIQEPYRESKKVSLQPSLEQAINTASTGDGPDLIKSMLLEMSEELATNRQAGEVMTNELISQSQAILSQIESARENLQQLFDHIRMRFRTEATLRKEVSHTLENILRISRAYESLSLELEVENATGFCRELKPEDKATDEQIATKESDIVKSLISIEERLADESASKRHLNPKEVVREIFSSLSLQGIRIRRVHELLLSLSQRLEEHDRGGRQSSLGLSLARLEQLRLDDQKSPERPKASIEGNPRRKETDVSSRTESKPLGSSSVPVDSHEMFPTNISRLLRKLAMRGGREHISPEDQGVKAILHTSIGEEEPRVDESLKNEIIPNHETRSKSQMDEVRGLLNSQQQSSETESRGYSTNPLNFKLEKQPKSAFEEKQLVFNATLSNGASTNRMVLPSGPVEQNKSSGTMLPQPLSSSQAKLPGGSAQGQRRLDGFSAIAPPRSYEKKSADVSNPRGQVVVRGSDATSALSLLNLSGKSPAIGAVDTFTPTQLDQITTSTDNERSSNSVSKSTQQQVKVTSFSVATSSNAKPPLPKLRLEKPATPKQTGDEEGVTPSTSKLTPAPIAKLPPDDFLTPATKTNGSKVPFASLPPDEFSSENNSATKPDIPFASLPPDDAGTDEPKKTDLGDRNVATQSNTGAADESQSSLDAKGSPFEQSAKEVSKAETPLAPPVSSQPSQTSPIPSFGASQPSLFSGLKLDGAQPSGTNTGGFFTQNFASPTRESVTPSLFGQKPTRAPSMDGVFGMSGLAQAATTPFSSTAFGSQQSSASQVGTSMFQAATQMNRSAENAGGGSPIAASDSEDSDDENLRQGMDTSMGASSAFSGSQPTSFGFGSQPASGGSLFGQAFSAAFQSPHSGGGQFTQSPVQPGSGFGGSSAFQGTLSSFGASTPSGMGSGFGSGAAFGMDSRIGGTPGFGMTSAIGMTPSFGSVSPVGAQASPFAMPSAQFGDSSFGNQSGQTSAMPGFGASSGAATGSSPFGALSGGAGFGRSAGSQSGFAALAGNSGGLVFGNGNGPPAFTSAAFTQRRA